LWADSFEADCWLRKALGIPWKIEYVGFRSWEFVLGKLFLNIGMFFTQALPSAFG
jgi:hypothetical protein